MNWHSPVDLSRGGVVVRVVVETRFIAFNNRFRVSPELENKNVLHG